MRATVRILRLFKIYFCCRYCKKGIVMVKYFMLTVLTLMGVYMDENYIDSGIRRRLIEAGLRELLEHGTRDFSLRRLAVGAQVSCAAPYRHFKDKDELVRAVIAQIREDWVLLSSEIENAFSESSADCITEMMTACVRFWIAGDNFAPFLGAGELAKFDEPLIAAIGKYADERGMSEAAAAELTSELLAITYGAVTIITSNRLDPTTAVANMRRMAKELLERA